MTRDDWLSQFEDELKKLRPHIGDRLAITLALQKYYPNENPRDLSRQYDKSLRPPTTVKKRAK